MKRQWLVIFNSMDLSYLFCGQIENKHSRIFISHDQQIVNFIEGKACDEYILNIPLQCWVVVCLVDQNPPQQFLGFGMVRFDEASVLGAIALGKVRHGEYRFAGLNG